MKQWFKKHSLPRLLMIFSAIMLLAGCGFPGLKGTSSVNTIRINAMETTESQILAEMIRIMIERETDHEAVVLKNLGTSLMAHQAMMAGDVDISAARFTGTEVAATLQQDAITDPEEAFRVVKEEFQKRFGYKVFNSYGFENSYAFLITKDFEKEHNIQNLSSFKDMAQNMRAGFPNDWVDRDGDGYKDFVETYGYSFGSIYPMSVSLVYDALIEGKMETVVGYTTDGRIASYDLTVVEDDLQFFPAYEAVIIMSKEALEEYPDVVPILERFEGAIDTETMQQLNYQSDHNLEEPSLVAKEFLKERNYLKGGE